MNISHLAFRIVLSVLLCVIGISFSTKSFAAEDDINSRIKVQMVQLENLWTANEINAYTTQAVEIVKVLTSQPLDTNSVSLSAKLLRSMSQKEFGAGSTGAGLLQEMQKLVLYIAKNDKGSGIDRQTNVTLLAEYLGRIRGARIRDFKRLPVVANVPPPAGVPGFSGMRPEAISDVTARSNYSRAIQQNRENNLVNRRQSLLPQLDQQATRVILGYMTRTIEDSAVSPMLISKWIDLAALDENERNELRKRASSE